MMKVEAYLLPDGSLEMNEKLAIAKYIQHTMRGGWDDPEFPLESAQEIVNRRHDIVRILTSLDKIPSKEISPNLPMDGERASMAFPLNHREFEEWASLYDLPLHMNESGQGRFYANDYVEWAWQGWMRAADCAVARKDE